MTFKYASNRNRIGKTSLLLAETLRRMGVEEGIAQEIVNTFTFGKDFNNNDNLEENNNDSAR